jgi:hypothetical protein
METSKIPGAAASEETGESERTKAEGTQRARGMSQTQRAPGRLVFAHPEYPLDAFRLHPSYWEFPPRLNS